MPKRTTGKAGTVKRQRYESTVLKRGSFARGRVALNMGSHIVPRVGNRVYLEKQKSGVTIPAEMEDGATVEALGRTVSGQLPRR